MSDLMICASHESVALLESIHENIATLERLDTDSYLFLVATVVRTVIASTGLMSAMEELKAKLEANDTESSREIVERIVDWMAEWDLRGMPSPTNQVS